MKITFHVCFIRKISKSIDFSGQLQVGKLENIELLTTLIGETQIFDNISTEIQDSKEGQISQN